MLSVIIPTRNSERPLVPTLAALVPGATTGLVTEVLIADGGSQDDTAAVADVAGCNFLTLEGSLAGGLKAAVSAARMPWLMFLRPGTVLDAPWTGEVARFLQQDARQAPAAVFRRGDRQTALREVLCAVAMAGSAPRPVPSRASSSPSISTTLSAAIPSAPAIRSMTCCAASAGGASSNWPPRRSAAPDREKRADFP